MGFADLAIADIAEDYNLSVEELFQLCDQLGISYKSSKTRLALEDVKALIQKITAQQNSEDRG
ncbi:translation initiation factor IF-2 [Desertifilum sp. FACHB-1129]|uniref:Translation initiation factor IF-2 n=2 Tax=Desertifilum tharense IPPAS B-1220 TaxID=1781255 RepID=A0A1E5QJY3_9CYAN|nr:MULTISPECIES: translation initiation factor IF-2 [Cyanophyceae]MCD8485590.1 translation initiation factor IF-2 [Desertifilum sp.]MDA0210446.1 translation initiation factor IF-2 [Cyanobacteria bacterium FC1]MDI9634966.1 translation initiation factor IF-2 [Geitlerinema splendidum]NES94376.1 translation initiation factor IF-2 [Desertifilum sp. SIO1I2]MBD2313917.1 translation initiation factor IF-2 [Desertifilum sp. FACHB-1129]